MNAKPVERLGPYLVKKGSPPKTVQLTLRISRELKDAMERAGKRGPYRIATNAIVERGIVLAIRELDELPQEAQQ